MGERLYSPMNRRPSGRRRRTTEHRRWATRDAFDIAVRIDARHPVLPVHRHVEVVVRIEGYTIAADETRVGHPHLRRAGRAVGLHRDAHNRAVIEVPDVEVLLGVVEGDAVSTKLVVKTEKMGAEQNGINPTTSL